MLPLPFLTPLKLIEVIPCINWVKYLPFLELLLSLLPHRASPLLLGSIASFSRESLFHGAKSNLSIVDIREKPLHLLLLLLDLSPIWDHGVIAACFTAIEDEKLVEKLCPTPAV
jgi:hypothetical protein